MGAQAIRDYRLSRDAQHVGRTVPEDGRSVRLAHRAGMMAGVSLGGTVGGQVGGLPGSILGAGVGGLVGNAAGRRWVQYEPAVMAAMADPAAGSVAARARGVLGNMAGRLTSPVEAVTVRATPSVVARLALAAPESLGRYGRLLSDAARRGTVDAALAAIRQHDPAGAAEIEQAIPIEQAQALPPTQLDPQDPGAVYRGEPADAAAPPPVDDDPELDPEDPGRRFRTPAR